MTKKKIIALVIISVMICNTWIAFGLAATPSTMQQTNSLAGDRSNAIINYFLDGKVKTSGNPLLGQGYGENGIFFFPLNSSHTDFAVENLFALPALEDAFSVYGESQLNLWASDDILNPITQMFSQAKAVYGILHDGSGTSDDIRYSMDQFVAMDMLSSYYATTKDDQVYNDMENLFNSLHFYESNSSSPYGGVGGYWTQIQGLNAVVNNQSMVTPSVCTTNTSLMAAAALSRFSMVIVGQYDNKNGTITNEALIKAEQAISFAEQYCYLNGFFTEYKGDTSKIIHLDTQAYALYALSLLYQASGKAFYLLKAEALLNNIAECFWDTGIGGAMELYNLATGSVVSGEGSIKYGFSNMMLALSCYELYKATGDSQYMQMTMEIMNFMDNYLWQTQGTDIQGYVEWCDRNGTLTVPSQYYGLTNMSRWSTTNMLALRINAEISQYLKPWYQKYMTDLIIGGIVAIAVIVVIVLVVRKSRAGTRLPKIAKGLLGGDED